MSVRQVSARGINRRLSVGIASAENSLIEEDVPQQGPILRRALSCGGFREKENRVPSSQPKVKERRFPDSRPQSPIKRAPDSRPQSPANAPDRNHRISSKATQREGCAPTHLESRPSVRHRSELELVSQLDNVREDLRHKSRQIAVKDRKLDELARKNEELSWERKEAFRKLSEVEVERDSRRRQLYEKEQELGTLQRKSDNFRIAVDELRKTDKREDEQSQIAAAESQRLCGVVKDLEERLAAANAQLEESAAKASVVDADVADDATRMSLSCNSSPAELLKVERMEVRVQELELDLSQALETVTCLEQELASERARCATAVAQQPHSIHSEPSSHNPSALKDLELERERRAREKAEADAESAQAELLRLSEWVDDQSMRELIADASRLEELDRVRRDVSRQVEEARGDTVEENRQLRRRIADLEQELATISQKTECERRAHEVTMLKADEERRAVDARAARSEAARALAEEEHQEEREGFQTRLSDAQRLVRPIRWRVLFEILNHRRVVADMRRLYIENRRSLNVAHSARRDLEIAMTETRRLRDREETHESDMSRIAEQNAELAGHQNHKQKIQYLANIKAENKTLRDELRKAKQHVAQLEGKVRAKSLRLDNSDSFACLSD